MKNFRHRRESSLEETETEPTILISFRQGQPQSGAECVHSFVPSASRDVNHKEEDYILPDQITNLPSFATGNHFFSSSCASADRKRRKEKKGGWPSYVVYVVCRTAIVVNAQYNRTKDKRECDWCSPQKPPRLRWGWTINKKRLSQ